MTEVVRLNIAARSLLRTPERIKCFSPTHAPATVSVAYLIAQTRPDWLRDASNLTIRLMHFTQISAGSQFWS